MSIITVLSTKLLGTYERTKPNRPSTGSDCKRQRMVDNKLDFDDSNGQSSYDFVWAFSSNTNPNKANYFKAALILFVIYLVLAVAVVIFGSAAANQYQ